MATSGSFNTSGWSDPSCPDYYTFSWSLSSQSTSGNYSVISWKLTAAGGSSGGYWTNIKEKYVTVNGATQSNATVQASYNGTVAFSGTATIYHNSDGTKSFSASAGGAFYYFGSYNSTGSGTWSLPTIARASTITSAADVTLGNKCSITWTPSNVNYQYDIIFTLGTWRVSTGKMKPNTTSSHTYNYYTIPADSTLLSQISSSTTGTMTATLITYDANGTQIGSSSSRTFTVTVPSNIVPSVGTITLTPQTYAQIIQGKNRLNIGVSGCSASTGSSIRSYTFSGPGISTTTTSTSATTSTISNTGTLTYTVTVTDNRGRTASKTATITCYSYSAPYFKSFNAYRCNSNGVANDSGTYVKCTYSLGYSAVNSTNDVTVKILYKKNTASNWSSSTTLTNSTNTSGEATLSSMDASSTYVIYATITDNYSGSSSSSQITVFSAFRVFNVTEDGTGFAIGKMADKENTFDCKWPIRSDDPINTMQNLSYRGTNLISSTSNDTVSNWNNQGNLATTFYTQTGKLNGQPSQYGFLLNLSSGIGGQEMHNLWFQQPNGGVAHRGGNGDGLGAWRIFLDSSNYTDYTIKKPTTLFSSSSGTIGTITLSSSAANYTYLEIYYTDNNGRQPNCVRVYSPNGKYVSLSCIEPSTNNNNEPRLYIRTSGWTISGTSMTVGRSDLSGLNRGVYGQIYPHVGGTNIDVNVTANNYIKIFRILGYA